MKVCFIMYPWDTINLDNDSTIHLVYECIKRGHEVHLTLPSQLAIRDSVTCAFVKSILPFDKVPATVRSFHKRTKFREHMQPLDELDAIILRSDPPLDMTMLNFLDSVRREVFIMNDIDGIRKANNKLYTASFTDGLDEIIPKTYVSKNKEYLKSVIKNGPDKMILKPFNGYGGSGVILLEKQNLISINSLLDFYIGNDNQSNYVILQHYIEGAEQGDVRILMLDGQPIGSLRRIPGEGDHRSNVSAGGSVVKHQLTKEERALCKKIGPKLIEDGLYFTGLDVINGKLVEVNVVSPGGINFIYQTAKRKVQAEIIDFVEKKVKELKMELTA